MSVLVSSSCYIASLILSSPTFFSPCDDPVPYSNYAAVVAELVGFDHFKADDGLQSLEQAVQILLDRMDEGGVLRPVLNEDGIEEIPLSASEALRGLKATVEGSSVKSTNEVLTNPDNGTVGAPLRPLPPVLDGYCDTNVPLGYPYQAQVSEQTNPNLTTYLARLMVIYSPNRPTYSPFPLPFVVFPLSYLPHHCST